MHFSKLVALATLPLLAVAMPGGGGGTTTVTVTAQPSSTPASSCSTGALQCCDSTSSASDPVTSLLLGLLGIVVEGVDALVGVTCSPISVVSLTGGGCSANAVCCEDNSSDNLISLGCIPVTL